MRIIIDTSIDRVIVPDSFFNQIDKMNLMIKATDENQNAIDYKAYLEKAIAKALTNAPVRKSDLKNLNR